MLRFKSGNLEDPSLNLRHISLGEQSAACYVPLFHGNLDFISLVHRVPVLSIANKYLKYSTFYSIWTIII